VPTLLVANAGGHVQELHRLLPRLRGVDSDVAWVTTDTAQTRTLLDGQEVHFVRYGPPRDVWTASRNLIPAARILGRRRFTHVVSTGAHIALSFLPLARAEGSRCHFIESATRVDGPSMTARVLRGVPGIHLYTQHASWLRPPWHYAGSVFDGFTTANREGATPDLRRVVVTVGSTGSYGFRSLIEKVAQILPPGVEVVWQTGATDVRGLGIDARPSMPAGELRQAMERADVVISHAGVGSTLVALEAGRSPILVPRRRHRDEHVDDHQAQVASELAGMGLVLACEVEDLDLDKLLDAAARSASESPTAPPFELRNDP
jgi:UDP-N-acetylglucosamine--N-acetylmuramyl-(pentapeptide) pyrophosphoryl-undecaprenol N-acetylglucosamine transferase